MPAKKYPSTRVVILGIIAFCALCAVGAFSLGTMNMKAKTDEEHARAETAAQAEPAAQGKKETKEAKPADEPESKSTAKITPEILLKPTKNDVILGEADAQVTMVEYSSLSCPHCAQFHNHVLPDLQKEYIKKGQLRLIMRPFPLNAPALKGSLLIACAPDDMKAQFTKVLFEMQPQWAFSPAYESALKQIAAVGGIDGESFAACMRNRTKEDVIIADVKQASDTLKIDATPTFFINGTRFMGEHTVEEFRKAIDAALDSKKPRT
jgi:protein-disulfide isomerase